MPTIFFYEMVKWLLKLFRVYKYLKVSGVH